VFRFRVVKTTSSLVVTHEISFPPFHNYSVAVNLLILLVILIGGETFSSVTIESTLEMHPDVLEVGVVAVADKEWGERPKAYVTPKSGSHIDGKEVIEWVRHNGISEFMVPREVEIVEELLPRTSTAKLKKGVMRKWAIGGGNRTS
jgi:acyl-coenzyme A synthetase/AMP-(fatty) acid ligase